MIYHLYTDGACQPNPGKGGWAFILFKKDNESQKIIKQGNSSESTNNKMELQSVLEGMKFFASDIWTGSEQLQIYSDSAYLVNGINDWVSQWEKQNWIKKDKKPVLNKDIWEKILQLKNKINPIAIHVDGHAGNVFNEEVDQLAVKAIRG